MEKPWLLRQTTVHLSPASGLTRDSPTPTILAGSPTEEQPMARQRSSETTMDWQSGQMECPIWLGQTCASPHFPPRLQAGATTPRTPLRPLFNLQRASVAHFSPFSSPSSAQLLSDFMRCGIVIIRRSGYSHE